MIGIFDSGLGGLSALKAARRLLPKQDIVYFGDTGRVPYGTKSKETIIRYALQDMRFLKTFPVDAVLVACGTVSSNALDVLRETFPETPIIGVIDAAVEKALSCSNKKIIGVAGTAATIRSGAFARALKAGDPSVRIVEAACPLFVPLVENGFIEKDNEITRLTVKQYLTPVKEAGADTLILGCTHFPIIAETISSVFPGIRLINVSEEAAKELASLLEERGLAGNGSGKTSYFVSDEPEGFASVASVFLGETMNGKVEPIPVEKF